MRLEQDAMGTLELPDEAYWGIVAERHRIAFDVGPMTLDDYESYVAAVALIKVACARANAEIGALDTTKASAIEKAAFEVAEGKFSGHFGINIFRGSGTPLNAAVNEVIAHRANELLSGSKTQGGELPNTHVNMAQSSNDVIPSAKDIVIYWELTRLINASESFCKALTDKAAQTYDVLKLGRTGLQDAVPETLGQVLTAYACGIRRMQQRLCVERERWCRSCLGGTAVGTGMGCLPGFRATVHRHLSDVLGRPMMPEENLMDGMMAVDGIILAHAHIVALANQVWKVARDIRIMAGGTCSGLREIRIPARKRGEDDYCERLITATNRVTANNSAVLMGLQSGWLDLGASSGIPIRAIIESSRTLSGCMDDFSRIIIPGIEANTQHCTDMANMSASLSTVISTICGYQQGSRVAHYAMEHQISVKQAALELRVLPPEVIEELFELGNLVDSEQMEALFHKYRHLRTI